ncbi:unnamed protein product [Polarella glacialis]|uniref:RING-type domain-containing protein n=1 Tax=Polarella glacialis TaxID=89957 RepID=A0A813FWT3_POLGL|nr:unnamed protein product [Polarella glacialis]
MAASASELIRWGSSASGYSCWCLACLAVCFCELTAAHVLFVLCTKQNMDKSFSSVCLAVSSYVRVCALSIFQFVNFCCGPLHDPWWPASHLELLWCMVTLTLLMLTIVDLRKVDMPLMQELLFCFVLIELLLTTVAMLCRYAASEQRELRQAASEHRELRDYARRRSPLQSLAINKFMLRSRRFVFQLEGSDHEMGLPGFKADQDLCTICLADFEDGDEVTCLACKHIFHSTCIGNWLNHARGPVVSCPLRCSTGQVNLLDVARGGTSYGRRLSISESLGR